MKVSAIQLPILLGNRLHNTTVMERMVNETVSRRPDVIVLPELWTTGFYPQPVQQFADLDGDSIVKTMSALAKRYMVNIVAGSVAVNRGGKIYNSSYVFNRSGHLVTTYDKVHLFSPSGEAEDFAAGNRAVTFVLDGVKCGLAICYDLRFPEFIRKLALEEISVLFIPAAWPIERIVHWDTLVRARAIENQMFVVAVNGISNPDDNDFHLGGSSAIIDPWGEILAQASTTHLEGEIIQANLRIAMQHKIHETIDVFKDRRPEIY